jgi:hypothetical protein
MDRSVVDAAVASGQSGVTLIGRFHDHRGAALALFVDEGAATFRHLTIAPLERETPHAAHRDR